MLVKALKRTNERTQKQNFIYLLVRFVALYKSPKRRNGISFLRLFVLSPSLKDDKTTKLPRNIKVWFVVVTRSYCRLFVLSTSKRRQNDRTTTRQNEFLRPFRFVVCLFCRVIQVAKTKKQNGHIRLPYIWHLYINKLTKLKFDF